MIHLMCSDACFNRFRATKGLKTSCCDACGTYINTFTSRAEYLLHEGQQRRFCNSSCLRLYKMVGAYLFLNVQSCTIEWYESDLSALCLISVVFDFRKTLRCSRASGVGLCVRILKCCLKWISMARPDTSVLCAVSPHIKLKLLGTQVHSTLLVYYCINSPLLNLNVLTWCLTLNGFSLLLHLLLFQCPVKPAVPAKEAPLNLTTVKQMRPCTSSVALAVGANFRLDKSIPLIEFGQHYNLQMHCPVFSHNMVCQMFIQHFILC